MTSDASSQVLAIIAVKGRDAEIDGQPVLLGGRPLIGYTIDAALWSPVVDRTVVTTDRPSTRELAVRLGAEAPFTRPEQLAEAGVSLDQVFQHCLRWLEEKEDYRPGIVITMETSHPIRPAGLVERVVGVLQEQKMDTVFTVHEERHAFWRSDEYGELSPLSDEESTPRAFRKPLYREMTGLALACRASLLRQEGRRIGGRIGIVPLREPYALVDTQDPEGLGLAEYYVAQNNG